MRIIQFNPANAFILGLGALLSGNAGQARGQQPASTRIIAGTVTDSVGGLGLGGVVVIGSSTGDSISRTLTGSAGSYRLDVPWRSRELRFRRIGFREKVVPITDTTTRIDVALIRLPTRLPPVTTVDESRCSASPSRRLALAFWNEARSALLSSVVMREASLAHLTMLRDMHWELNDGRIEPITVERDTAGHVERAFGATKSAGQFAREGYVEDDPTGRTYYGPDERVLFSEEFLLSHCFDLAGSGDDSIVKLRFTPARGRHVGDIEGSVWLARDPLELLRIEFGYDGVEREISRAHAGGSLDFRTMPNGVATLWRWKLRSPRKPNSMRQGPLSDGRFSDLRAGIVDVLEVQVTLARVVWTDSSTWELALPTWSGTVRAQAGTPAANRKVQLVDTPYIATTDSLGRFDIEGVLPGRYRVRVWDLGLFDFGFTDASERTLEVRPNSPTTLTLDSPQDVAKRACSQRGATLLHPEGMDGNLVALVRIVNADGTMQRRDFRIVARTEKNRHALDEPRSFAGSSDDMGRFRLCGLEPADILIAVDGQNGRKQIELVIEPSTPLSVVTITLPPG